MSVKSKVIDVINNKSFITLKEFMQISLHDEEFGYYKKNVFRSKIEKCQHFFQRPNLGPLQKYSAHFVDTVTH